MRNQSHCSTRYFRRSYNRLRSHRNRETIQTRRDLCCKRPHLRSRSAYDSAPSLVIREGRGELRALEDVGKTLVPVLRRGWGEWGFNMEDPCRQHDQPVGNGLNAHARRAAGDPGHPQNPKVPTPVFGTVDDVCPILTPSRQYIWQMTQ